MSIFEKFFFWKKKNEKNLKLIFFYLEIPGEITREKVCILHSIQVRDISSDPSKRIKKYKVPKAIMYQFHLVNLIPMFENILNNLWGNIYNMPEIKSVYHANFMHEYTLLIKKIHDKYNNKIDKIICGVEKD